MREHFNLLAPIWVAFLLTCSVHGFSTSKSADESSENLARWKDRWETNTLGWHRTDVNDVIRTHGDKLFPEDDSCTENFRIFVPLCGKSLDMAHFARDERVTEVVGLDGIHKSLREFARENPDLGLKEAESIPAFEVMKGKNITLLKGDLFDLLHNNAEPVGKFEAVYDRASLVALQPPMREKYLEIMGEIIMSGGRILLVTVEHDAGSGPPFSILESDVRSLYEHRKWVDSVSVLNPDEAERDASGRISRWYLVQTK